MSGAAGNNAHHARHARRRLAWAALALAAMPFGTAAADDEAIPVRVQVAVDHGLEWLAAHQDANGAFGSNDARTAITSLAVLAFLARGHAGTGAVWRTNQSRH